MAQIKRLISDPEERGRHADAVMLANKAVKKGWIKKKPCEICGEPKVEMHHEDYWRPFYIWFLCKKHHTLADYGKIELIPRPEHEEIESMLSLQYTYCQGRGPKILQGLSQRGRAQAQRGTEAIPETG